MISVCVDPHAAARLPDFTNLKEAFSMFCTNCGKEVHGKFCTNCGAQVLFDEDPAAETAANAPAESAADPMIPEAVVNDEPAQSEPVQAPEIPQSAPETGETPAAPQTPVPPQPPVTPAQPSNKQKKPMGAGKIVAIVLGSIFGVALIAALLLFFLVIRPIKKAAEDITWDTDDWQGIVDDLPDTTEIEPTAEPFPTEESGAPVYYDGLLFMQVDEAHYEGSDLVADVTIWNTCEFGVNNIQDLMVALYDANNDLIATGNFFFDAPYQDEAGVVESEGYTETTLVFNSDSGSEVALDRDLSTVSASFELMCRMYDENDKMIGERVETRLFAICLPADWAGTVDYYMTDNAYVFFNIANSNAGAGGELFAIEYYENESDAPADAELLGSDAYYYYYATYPSDVQYDETSDKLTQEYQQQYSQIPDALYTLNIF